MRSLVWRWGLAIIIGSAWAAVISPRAAGSSVVPAVVSRTAR